MIELLSHIFKEKKNIPVFIINKDSEQTEQTYRIWPNYRTYPYKRTIKQFCSLYIIASVFLSTSL